MITLSIILRIVGFLINVPILWTIGIVVLVIGLILLALGLDGPTRGRAQTLLLSISGS